MKKTILLTLCLFASQVLLSQVNTDSLKAIFHDRTQADSVRLEALYAVSNAVLFSQPDSAIFYAQQLYEEATKLDNKVFVGLALNTKGTALNVKGYHDMALENLERSLNIFEEVGVKK
ncbi:MAG: hypothetical protein EP344_07070, partial [Bacteroidetes bacterium]